MFVAVSCGIGFLAITTTLYAIVENVDAITALYETVQVFSTVGFGDTAPTTTAGRIITMVLSLFGIGLLGAMCSFSASWSPTFTVCWVVFFMTGSSLFFSFVEGWSYFDAVYFTFSMCTTVGFGDLYPRTDAGRLAFCVCATLSVGPVAKCLFVVASRFRDSNEENRPEPEVIFGDPAPIETDAYSLTDNSSVGHSIQNTSTVSNPN